MSISKSTVLLLEYIDELEAKVEQMEQMESEFNEVCETLERVNQESVNTLMHQLEVAQHNADTYKMQHAKAMAEMQDRSAMLMSKYGLSTIDWKRGAFYDRDGEVMTIVPFAEVTK